MRAPQPPGKVCLKRTDVCVNVEHGPLVNAGVPVLARRTLPVQVPDLTVKLGRAAYGEGCTVTSIEMPVTWEQRSELSFSSPGI